MHRFSAFALHATAAGIMAWGHAGALRQPFMRKLNRTQKGGHAQFLTHHGLVFALSYMVVSMFCDVSPFLPVVDRLKKTLLVISMPLALIISSIYWSLLFASPYLIAPEAIPRLPVMIDMTLHASPSFFLLIDFYTFEPKFPKTYIDNVAPVAAVVLPVWYASFVEYCAVFNGSFPYPFLNGPFPNRVLIYATTAGAAFMCFRVLNALHA